MREAREPDFFLTSTEGYRLEEVRACWVDKRIASTERDDLLLVRVDPPLPSTESYGPLSDRAVIAARHRGHSLFPITEWPAFVHVARLVDPDAGLKELITPEQYELMGWGELYATRQDAITKRM